MIGSIILGPMITGAKMHRSLHRRSSPSILLPSWSSPSSHHCIRSCSRCCWRDNRMNQSTIALLLDERWIGNEISIELHDIPLLVIHCWVWFGESILLPLLFSICIYWVYYKVLLFIFIIYFIFIFYFSLSIFIFGPDRSGCWKSRMIMSWQ